MTIHTRQMRSPKPGEERRKASAEELAAMVVKRSETSDNRRNALLAVIDSGEGKRCLPMIVAVLDDADEYNRYLAYQLLTEYYPDLPSRVPSLLNLGSVDDPKDRLAVIRDVVRILPDVGAALAAQAPGWQALQRLTKQGTAEETGDPPMPPEKPPPGDDPEPAKEGGMKNDSAKQAADSVVTTMRKHPGSWVAWNEAKRTVIAVADSAADLMKHVTDLNDPNLVVEVAPGLHPLVANRPFKLLDDESSCIIDDVKMLWGGTADDWLDSPNKWFHGRTPRQLIGTPEEKYVRYLLRAIRNGTPA